MQVADDQTHQSGDPWGLTRREAEVLTLVVRGLTNKEMANELRCSAKTIELHVSHLLRKAGVPNRVRLLAKLLASAEVERLHDRGSPNPVSTGGPTVPRRR